MNFNTIQDAHKAYEELHANPDYFRGFSLHDHIPDIMRLCRTSNVRSLLDYGCGKAEMYKEFRLRRLFGLEKLTLYDPGVPEYAAKPPEAHDIVVCVDVLEHVPEQFVDDVLSDLACLTKKVLYLCVATRPASKTFKDGTNVHLTVKPRSWWLNKVRSLPVFTVITFST
jgi:hypothetical protein